MRMLGTRLLARLVRRASDARLERWFGSAGVQRAMFRVMAAGFDPAAAEGFRGRVVYELSRPETSRPASTWTIEIRDDRAIARPGRVPDTAAALTLRVRLADFIRIAAGLVDPAIPLLQNRASLTGDLAVAARLPEMFGLPRPQ